MIDIQISDDYKNEIQEKIVANAVEATIRNLKKDINCEITVVIDNDEFIKEINKNFRGIDNPTDVLSFPSNEINPETGNVYQGDIIISYPTAVKQAVQYEHSIMDEIQLLVVHGTLHLFGYDHAEEIEKTKMWAIQAEILAELGCKITRLPE